MTESDDPMKTETDIKTKLKFSVTIFVDCAQPLMMITGDFIEPPSYSCTKWNCASSSRGYALASGLVVAEI